MGQLRVILARGHARTLPNPEDRRSYRVLPAAAGRAAHREASRRFEATHATLSAALATDEPDGEVAAKRALLAMRVAAEAALAAFEAGPAARAVAADDRPELSRSRSAGPGD